MPNPALLSPLLVAFVATTLFGFVIGLELHSYRRAGGQDLGFGTTRTFTLLAVLGFALTLLDPSLHLFGFGLIVVAALLALNYHTRLRAGQQSLLATLIALLVFLIGPLSLHQPMWLLILYVVVILLLLGEKPGIRRFSDAFRSSEAATLAKFLIMAGLILPLLPERQIAPFLSVTYYQLWLAVIVVSGISYLSYFAQTYFFPARGALLTGVLGGLYSSTAATVVLGRQARESAGDVHTLAAAIVLATAMMYLRLFSLILILGHEGVAWRLVTPFGLLLAGSIGLAWGMRRKSADGAESPAQTLRHPLEFSTAVLFAFLFVLFAALTHWVIGHYGAAGLHALSFAVGFTDIDPFILSLLAGRFHVDQAGLAAAVIVASGSNNLLKGLYALALSRNRHILPAATWLFASCLLSLAYVFWHGG
ncbi:MgtC/SapB family protein [Acidihalobacter prosperus]|uniref:DUF4010 domain-containing protein n=1 Tax=Acidihalobacter prosperus TaxID=160660 RepID=A0A1A6C7J2_9GAMM|nr:DUF4010 domain-containing protein [Acidihalobacter prosperus]OBS10531.1 hypothetical protein Thpro_020247 [Acidihalobacter prosperus]